MLAGAYYVWRSHPAVLPLLSGAWAFAVALLALRLWGRRSLSGVAVMLLFSLCVASILDVRPDLEITRLWAEGPPPFDLAPRVQVLRRFSRPGDRVVAMTTFSHELASRAGLRDVYPFSDSFYITYPELRLIDHQLQGTRLAVTEAGAYPTVKQWLQRHEFVIVA